jgi:hypothetical protein
VALLGSSSSVAVRAAEAISHLVALMGSSSAIEVLENVAVAIMNLALNADNRALILVVGVVAPLLQLAGLEDAAVKKMAEDALRFLGSEE